MADGYQEPAVIEQTVAPEQIGHSDMSEADLNALIDQELGLATPAVEPKVEESASIEEQTPEEEPEPPVKEEQQPAAEPATPSNEELFIEVEDAEGVVHRITNLEDLPDDFVPKNNRQALEILRQLDKLDTDIAKQEAEKQTAAEQAAVKEIETQQYSSWDAEIAELTKEKRLTTNDTDKVDKVFAHMAKVNDARIKAGNPNLISSFEDALDKYEAVEAKEAAEEATKNGNALAKAKSGLIGRSNAPTASTRKPYVSGSVRNIEDMLL